MLNRSQVVSAGTTHYIVPEKEKKPFKRSFNNGKAPARSTDFTTLRLAAQE